ncbi:Uncharacterised protein [Mycobacteroides abscessus subsp. abscessus]|nr:Uncharacterised protein [Mycobacteroides abscessus subsp. abscessus]
MTSLVRPVMKRLPSTRVPRSPVRNQPPVPPIGVAPNISADNSGRFQYPAATLVPRSQISPISPSGRGAPSAPTTETSIPPMRPLATSTRDRGAPSSATTNRFSASASPSTTAVVTGVPCGSPVTNNVASASPYTGVTACSASPNGASSVVNRSIEAHCTGSDPLSSDRTHDRSTPSSASCVQRRATRSKAKFGATPTVARYFDMARIHWMGCLINVTGDRKREVPP